MLSARSISTSRAPLHGATQFQIESLEKRVLLSTAIAAFGAQQTFGTGSNPRSVAIADINTDGKLDLLVANSVGNSAGILLGNGNGTYQPQQTFAVGSTPFSIAAADVNLDGKLDLITANNGGNNLSVLLGNGNGTFQSQRTFGAGTNARFIAVADINGDGKPDLVTANYGIGAISVLLGNGNGTFQNQQTFSVGAKPSSIAVADFNADGKLDLAVVNKGSNNVSVLLGNGNGTFQTQQLFTVGSAPFSIATGDLNQDGKLDLVTADESSNAVSVLLGNGNGTFQTQQTYATGLIPCAVAISDINGDGNLDVVAANYSSNSVSVFLGNGNGTLQPQKTFATSTNPFALAVADVNNDIRQDLLVANEGSNNIGELLGDVPPTVLSINRTDPDASTAALSVRYTVTFSETVTGVVPSEFTLSHTGSVSAATPVAVSGGGAVFTVTINGISGSGTLTLNLLNDGTIKDAAGNPLQPGNILSFAGQQYSIFPPAYALTTVTPFGTNDTGTSPAVWVRDTQGNLFGTTAFGGADAMGTVFELPHGGTTITPLASFNDANGASPSKMIADGSGNLYGATYSGGAYGGGTIFEVPHNTATIVTLASFPLTGSSSSAGPAISVYLNGNLYGTTYDGGDNGLGSIFEIPHGSSTVRTLASFDFNSGRYPAGTMVMDANGDLFGTTQGAGADNAGTIFELAAGASTVTTLVSFNGTNGGSGPQSGLIADASGNYYGSTQGGGANGYGTIFELPAGSTAITTLASFSSSNASGVPLALDGSDNLYGTSFSSSPFGGGSSTVFELPHGSSTIKTLTGFSGQNGYATIVVHSTGDVYGATVNSGAYNTGSVFELPSGSSTVSTLASFDFTSGNAPSSGLLRDSAGNLYGDVYTGGAHGVGGIFEIPHGNSTMQMLASFTSGAGGQIPLGPLAMDAAGNLFGTMEEVDANNDGSMFELSHGASSITSLGLFNGPDGQLPLGALAIDANGNVFGTTAGGGANNDGTVFEVAHGATTITTVVSFNGSNGSGPEDGVVINASGNLYGTTEFGGANGYGKVFELAHGSSTITQLASFTQVINGDNHASGVVLDGSGNLFGLSSYGVFELPDGNSTITLIAPYADSESRWDDPVIDSAGDLFGISNGGGAQRLGAVFELAHGASKITMLASFTGPNGYGPVGALAIDAAGDLYGNTWNGGYDVNNGIVFEVARIALNDTIAGTSGNDSINLTVDSNGTSIDWKTGDSIGQLPINDPNGLTINDPTGNNVITADYLESYQRLYPLPNTLHLNGTFTIDGLQGSSPLAANTRLEIGRSTVYINYANNPDPVAAIQQYLKVGFNNGAWNGAPTAITGVITSVFAAQNAAQTTAIGYADSADGLIAGQPANTIELKYTLYGDTTLTGTVGFNDFTRMTQHWNQTSGGTWDTGDFNYDGSVNSADFTLMTRTYNTSLGSQAIPAISAASAAPKSTVAAVGSSAAGTTEARTPLPVVQTTDSKHPKNRRGKWVRKGR